MRISKYKKFLLENQKPGMISQASKKDLLSWMSYPGHQLLSDTVKELENNETIKPKEKVTLYRGLLFTRKSPELKSEMFAYHSERYSAWTYSIQTATRFAKYNRVGTGNGFIDFIFAERRDGLIDGELGIILSREFSPSEILIDSTLLKNRMNTTYGDEREVIVKPFDDDCKILKVYTKREAFDSFDAFRDRSIDNGYEKVIEFLKNFDFPIKEIEALTIQCNADVKTCMKEGLDVEMLKNVKRKFTELEKKKPELLQPAFGKDESETYSKLKEIYRNIDRIFSREYSFNSYTAYIDLISLLYGKKDPTRMKTENKQVLIDKIKKDYGENAAENYQKCKKYGGNELYLMNSVIKSIEKI
jgi:hypothetical protein